MRGQWYVCMKIANFQYQKKKRLQTSIIMASTNTEKIIKNHNDKSRIEYPGASKTYQIKGKVKLAQ